LIEEPQAAPTGFRELEREHNGFTVGSRIQNFGANERRFSLDVHADPAKGGVRMEDRVTD
jgi:hypothetical protein